MILITLSLRVTPSGISDGYSNLKKLGKSILKTDVIV
jgi:hypothetical protein